MMRVAYRTGDSPYGLPLVKFSLTYDGELPSTANGSRKPEKKWEIREHFHPQLEELWRVHPTLRKLAHGRLITPSAGPFMIAETYHEVELPPGTPAPTPPPGAIDLCAPIDKWGRSFKPLVRKTFALVCGLRILFLRKEKPGRVYQGGDLDNRLKTLLDALAIPENKEQIPKKPSAYSPILCLAETDALFTSISVDSERLLTGPNASDSYVRLIIEVDVRVTDSRSYNSLFLGD